MRSADPDAAAHSALGGVIASGVHTTAIFQRLAPLAVYNRYDCPCSTWRSTPS
ncbi:MAG: hypothetical protein ABI692_01785 [Terracoccus sp.]